MQVTRTGSTLALTCQRGFENSESTFFVPKLRAKRALLYALRSLFFESQKRSINNITYITVVRTECVQGATIA